MKQIACAFALIFSGFILDIGEAASWITETQWYDHFDTFKDIQSIGFALLAFSCCAYIRTELKVSTFFLLIWRVLVFIINITDLSSLFSWSIIYATMALYIAWFLKAWLMGEYKHSKERPGAYRIFLPVHSAWGLLQSVFLPRHPARYESRMISDGKVTWYVNKKEFVKDENNKLNIEKLNHVKVYLNRPLTTNEIMKLDLLQGQNVIPGWKDCREIPKCVG